MNDYILNAIKFIESRKKDKNKYPTYALRQELMYVVQKGMNKALDELEAEGKIKIGDALNDKYYEIR